MVASAAIAGVGAAAKLATLPGSFKEQRKMQKSLDGLRSKPMARYSVDPKISEMYKQAMARLVIQRVLGEQMYLLLETLWVELCEAGIPMLYL